MTKIVSERRKLEKGEIVLHPVLLRRFAVNLKTWRIKRELSHEGLATRAGISGPYVSMLEAMKRTPSFEIVEMCAKALGVDPAILLKEV